MVHLMRWRALCLILSAALRTCERPAASTGSPGGGLESGEARHGDSNAPGSSPVPSPLSWSPNATWWSEDVRPYGLPERSERARSTVNRTPRTSKGRGGTSTHPAAYRTLSVGCTNPPSAWMLIWLASRWHSPSRSRATAGTSQLRSGVPASQLARSWVWIGIPPR
mgnify:CR=1 FL=1